MCLYKYVIYSWSNIDTDLLECSHCRAKLCISFDDSLTPGQRAKVEQHYKEQLTTKGHASELCLFYGTKKLKASSQKDEWLPLHLAAVLDPNFVAWLDHPAPQTVLLERAQHIEKVAAVTLAIVPEDDDEQQLIDHICEKIMATGVSSINNRATLACVLLGWTTTDKDTADSALLECKLCLSSLQHPTTSAGTSASAASSLIKRHKYYCPYRCGITNTEGEEVEPCWKTIASRTLASLDKPEDEEDYQGADATLQRIQNMLAQQ